MTIYEIKRVTQDTAPCFFERKTLKFFGQTLKDFRVTKCSDGRYKISAPIYDHDGKKRGVTVRLYNPITDRLDKVNQ